MSYKVLFEEGVNLLNQLNLRLKCVFDSEGVIN